MSFVDLARRELNLKTLLNRRIRLSSRLDGTPCLFASGAYRPRNYAAATYRYRANSHFLWLVGLPFQNSFLLLHNGDATLYLKPTTLHDAVWEGTQPSFDEISKWIGVKTKPIDQLEAEIAPIRDSTLSISAPDRETCLRLSGLLYREFEPGKISECDFPLAQTMIELRIHHDETALKSMRKAALCSAAAHRAAMRATRPGRNEYEIHGEIMRAIYSQGMVEAYGPIITTHGHVLHIESYPNRMKAGELLLVDAGAETPGGWASDVTRTWPVSGKFSSTQREIYELVLETQLKSIAAVKPGKSYKEIHLLAAHVLTEGLVSLGILKGNVEELVSDGVHAIFFPHGLGHLLGLDVHDMEDLGDLPGYPKGRKRDAQFGLNNLRMNRDLEPGTCLTIEPGFYMNPTLLSSEEHLKRAQGRIDFKKLTKFKDVRGIRIEDDILVTKTGREVLTRMIPKLPKDLEKIVGRGEAKSR